MLEVPANAGGPIGWLLFPVFQPMFWLFPCADVAPDWVFHPTFCWIGGPTGKDGFAEFVFHPTFCWIGGPIGADCVWVVAWVLDGDFAVFSL